MIAEAAARAKPLRLDSKINGGKDRERMYFLPEIIPDERERVNEDQDRALYNAVTRLPQRLRHIISGYFFQGKTQREIGEELEISESRICQLKGDALRELRKLLPQEE